MLLFNFAFIFAASGSCTSLLSSYTAAVTASEVDNNIGKNYFPLSELRSERFHGRQMITTGYTPSDASPTPPNEDAATQDLSTPILTISATASAISTPLPDVPYEHHSDGSAITLAIIVSIIGGALLLTLAGWAWRKQKEKKSFGPDHHDAELAKHRIMKAGGAPGGASRHYSGNMMEVDARPYQRSPAGQRYVLQQHY